METIAEVSETIAEVCREWGLGTSTLTKALQSSVSLRQELTSPQKTRRDTSPPLEGRQSGKTWLLNSKSKNFYNWLRAHVLSRRVKAILAPLINMAEMALDEQLWRVSDADKESHDIPLKMLFQLSRDLSAGSDHLERQARVRLSESYTQQLTDYLARPVDTERFVLAFLQVLDGPCKGNLLLLFGREKLYRFAYAVYLQDALSAQIVDMTKIARDEHFWRELDAKEESHDIPLRMLFQLTRDLSAGSDHLEKQARAQLSESYAQQLADYLSRPVESERFVLAFLQVLDGPCKGNLLLLFGRETLYRGAYNVYLQDELFSSTRQQSTEEEGGSV